MVLWSPNSQFGFAVPRTLTDSALSKFKNCPLVFIFGPPESVSSCLSYLLIYSNMRYYLESSQAHLV